MNATPHACAGASGAASNYDYRQRPNEPRNETITDFTISAAVKEATIILLGLPEGADPLFFDRRRRLRQGALSGDDLLLVYRAMAEYHRFADTLNADRAPEDLARFIAGALALGPDPGRKFGKDEVDGAIATLKAEERRKARVGALPKGMSVRELLEKDFPPPAWIVENLLTTGVTVFAGAPKLGKSWMALGLGSSVGSGGAFLGRYHVERRRSLYLALEDVPRRLKARLEKIGASPDSILTIYTEWRSGAEGLADLDAWLYENPGTQLVAIDTLARFRGKPEAGENLYDYDYRITAGIKAIADKHECAIVLIHHVRKMASEDVMETVSGSNGLNGAADCTWILTRARGEADATLFVTGRDVEEQSLALRFDPDFGTWLALGDAGEYTQSRERREVLEAVPLEPASRKTRDIVALVGKKPAAVSRLLEKLEAEGLVFSPHYGEWSRRGGKSGNSVKPEPEVNPQYGTWEDLEGGNSGNSVKAEAEPEEPELGLQEEPKNETFTDTPDLPPSPPTEEAKPEPEAREEPPTPPPPAEPKAKPARRPRKPRELKYLLVIKEKIGENLAPLSDDLARHQFVNELLKFCKRRKASEDAPWSLPQDGTDSNVPSALGESLYSTKMFIDYRLIVTGEGSQQQHDLMAGIVGFLKEKAIAYGRGGAS